MLALIAGNRSVDPDAINHNAGDKSRIVDPTTGEVVDVFNATAAYDFTITDAQKGLYDLDIKAAGLDDNTDSFWVQVLQQTAPGIFTPLEATLTDNLLAGNNNGLAVFTNHTGIFEWLNAGLWDLLAGTYRIQITMRESGVGIDQIRIGQYQQAPGDDRVDINSIGGIVEINGGSGDDSFYVNYDANGVQTDENGIGITRKDTFSGTGSRTIFGLAKALATTQLLSVVVNGEALTFDQYTVDLATSTRDVPHRPGRRRDDRDHVPRQLAAAPRHERLRFLRGRARGQRRRRHQRHRPVPDRHAGEPARAFDRPPHGQRHRGRRRLPRPPAPGRLLQPDARGQPRPEPRRARQLRRQHQRRPQSYGRDGDDTFRSTTTSRSRRSSATTATTRFQVGQVFESPRRHERKPRSRPTSSRRRSTTRGFLSNGISSTTTLFGGTGDDTFTVYHNLAALVPVRRPDDDTFPVRAFVTVNPRHDPKAPFTNINGGQGADFISYTVNAPVRIDGGDGLDTLIVLGTEFGDDFVVTDKGVFGAGLYITYTGVEKLVVDGGEGNDRFYVAGTSAERRPSIHRRPRQRHLQRRRPPEPPRSDHGRRATTSRATAA